MAYKVLICCSHASFLTDTLEVFLKRRDVVVRIGQTDAVVDDEVVIHVGEDDTILVDVPGEEAAKRYERPVDIVRLADDVATMAAANPEEKLLARLSGTGLNVGAGLRYTAADHNLFIEVVQSFVSDSGARLQHLRDFYATQDWKNYGIQAHSLKSSARTIGADTLADMAFGQELASKEGRISDIYAGYEPLMDAYERLVGDLRDVLGSTEDVQDQAAEPIEADELRAVLQEALDCLETFEAERALHLLEQVVGRSFRGESVSDSLGDIMSDLDNFEVDGAATRLRELIEAIS